MKFTTNTRRTLAVLATAAVAATTLMVAAPAANAAAAGKKEYVCVLSTGQTIAVKSGQKPATTCKGANAIQVYYQTGQFIRTVSLSPSGKKATAHFTPGQDCLLAVTTGGASIILSGAGVASIFTGAISVGTAGAACISA